MNLWWFISSSRHCRYDELKQRRCIALGWPELGDLSRYIKDKPGWERQFKTFSRWRGNLAYGPHSPQWTEADQHLNEGIPAVFWEFIHINVGDYIVVMETGSQITLGNIEVMGIAKVMRDALSSYHFDDQFHHAHQVCGGLQWHDWNRARHGELEKPKQSFKALLKDNEQLSQVADAWQDQLSEIA